MSSDARPTFLCHAWAAHRLLAAGKVEDAEDELAAAFGKTILRVHEDGRLLAKLSYPANLSDAEFHDMISKAQAAVLAECPQAQALVSNEAHP